MKHLEEKSNGFQTTFSLTVPSALEDLMRKHLTTLLKLMENAKEEDMIPDVRDSVLPGPELKRLRQSRKITQKGLAQALGTTQARVSDMEQGIKPIPPEMAARCAAIFGVSAKIFLL